MALPTSGILTTAMINEELGRGPYDSFTINDAAVRDLGGKPTGRIAYSDLQGAARAVLDASLGIIDKTINNPGGTTGDGETTPTTYSYGAGYITMSNGSRYGTLTPNTTTDGYVVDFLGVSYNGADSPATAIANASGILAILGSPPGDYWNELIIDGLSITRTGLGTLSSGGLRIWGYTNGGLSVKKILGDKTSGNVSVLLR